MANQPYIFGAKPSGGRGRSSGLNFNFGVTAPDMQPKALTANQMMMLEAAKKKGHSESFWDRIKSGGGHGLHGIEWTFDKILRPAYGLSEAIASEHRAQNKGASFMQQFLAGAKGFEHGFMGKEKHGFGAALPFTHDTPEHHTFLKGHRYVRGILGFGADVVFDPLTYVGGGSTIFAKSGEHAAAIAGGRRAITDAGARIFTHDPERLTEAIGRTQHDVGALSKMGENYRYRKALAKVNLRELKAAQEGRDLSSTSWRARKRLLTAGAHAEEKRVEKFIPHYALAGKKITPGILGKTEKIGARSFAEGRQVVPALPKIDNFIARDGIGSGAARRFREAFIRTSTESPETHAMGIAAKHLGERIAHEQFRFATLTLGGLVKGINAKRQREILHLFEKPPKGIKAIIKKDGIHGVNPKYVTHLLETGAITPKEAEFAKNYQLVMEHLFHNEKAFGATTKHFSEGGRMYVPHLMDNQGHALNDEMRLLTTKAGFERARSDREFSLKQLVDFAEGGKLPKGVVADPYELLVSRIRASARRQSELGALDTFATVGGTRTKLVDARKLDAVRGHKDQLKQTLDLVLAGHEEDVAAAQAALRKIKFGKNTKTKAANLARAQKALDKLKTNHDLDTKTLNKKMRELNAEEKKLLRGRKNPAYKTHMTRTGMKDEYGHVIAMEGDIAQAATKVRRVIEGDDAAIKGFEGAYRKMLSKWKVLVTSINPGYRMRNSSTDLWNWWLQPGITTVAMTRNMGRAVKFMHTMKNVETRTAKEGLTPELRKTLHQFEDMYDNGVLSGLFQGDVQTAAEMLRLGHSKAALFKKVRGLKFVEKAAQDMNRNGENFIRIAHYLWNVEDKGMAPAEAALGVKAAHFDYEDLTPFEQRRLKAVAPFYTWTRKNIPYQIKSIIRSPGKYAAFPKGAMETENAAGSDKGNIVPDFIAQGFGVHVGGHNYVMPQLGVSDLAALDSPSGLTGRVAGLVSPAIRTPIELYTNKNLFTGGQIASDTHSRAPVSPAVATLLRLLPGSNVGTTSRIGPGGKHVYGPGANPYMVYLASQLGPLFNTAQKTGGIKRANNPVSPLWSELFGISAVHVDPEQQAIFAQLSLQDQAKKMVQDYRDQGLIPQAKHRNTKRTRQLENMVKQELGRR